MAEDYESSAVRHYNDALVLRDKDGETTPVISSDSWRNARSNMPLRVSCRRSYQTGTSAGSARFGPQAIYVPVKATNALTKVRIDRASPKMKGIEFPVLTNEGGIESSLSLSQTLEKVRAFSSNGSAGLVRRVIPSSLPGKQNPMTTFEQASVILSLSDSLREHGSWTGETHVQKSACLLQEMLGVPTGLRFVFYKHGPFSFDLRSALTFMESEDLISWQAKQKPYGPSLVPGPDADYLRSRYSEVFDEHGPRIQFLAERLAGKSVRELEKITTAFWVAAEGVEPSCRVSRIVELKPHIRPDEAKEAIEELEHLEREVHNRFEACGATQKNAG